MNSCTFVSFEGLYGGASSTGIDNNVCGSEDLLIMRPMVEGRPIVAPYKELQSAKGIGISESF